MSYDLAVWHTGRRLTAAEADVVYGQLCDGVHDGVVPHPGVEAFYAELTARYPELNNVPEERLDDSPWSCEIDRSPGHLLMCCGWSRAQSLHQFVRQLARRHGLAIFDPQSGTVLYPD